LIAYLVMGWALWLMRQEIAKRQRAEAELVTTNQALQRHAEQLGATNHELESFSYSVSHDLRIPLRAISGYARMLEEDYGDRLDAEAKRLLDVIRDNSHRMGALIDDLLAFSRLGRAALTPTEVNMKDLVAVSLQEVMRREEFRRTEVVIGDLPNAVGDRALLQQVWINLIANACKYSGTREHPVVRIDGEKQDHEIRYAVSDNGVGFDMQYAGKLFGVFQRLHGADEFPGTGVGLAIVHRIVTRHGGRVWAHGELDQGARFFFTLPAESKANGNG
jgi:light-regulated signal transduction histidine kinase (bacteriophytochrome)